MRRPKIALTLVEKKGADGAFAFCCPDADVLNIFRIDVEERGESA